MEFELILNDIAQNAQNFRYTHSEVVALVACLEENLPDLEFSRYQKVRGMLKGLRKYGITHNTRSNIALLILRVVEEDKQEKNKKPEFFSEF